MTEDRPSAPSQEAQVAALVKELLASPRPAVLENIGQLGDRAPDMALLALEKVAYGEAQDLALAALEALGHIRSQAAARLLSRLAQDAPGAQRRKAARRSLHRLKSAGLALVAPSPPQGAPLPPPRPTYVPYRTFASHIDGRGYRLIHLGLEDRSGGIHALRALVSDEVGLKDLVVVPQGKKRFDREAAALPKAEFPTWVEIPAPYGQYLVKEAAALNRPTGQGMPWAYLAWQGAIENAPVAYQRPLIYEELGAVEVRLNPAYLEHSPDLLDLKEFASWPLEGEQLRRYRQELQALDSGSIVLPEPVKQEQQEDLLDGAVAQLFDAGARARYQRRLEEMAYVLLRTDRGREARRALAAALALGEAAPSPLQMKSPQRHPFLAALIKVGVERAAEAAERPQRQGLLWLPR